MFGDSQTNPGRMINEIPLKPTGLKGNFYLHDEWQYGYFIMTDGYTSDEYQLKYDLENHNLEIMVKNKTKVLDLGRLDSFKWFDIENNRTSIFSNCDNFKIDEIPLIGVFEILYMGKVSLLSKTEFKIKKATYNIALDIGDRSDKVLKQKEYYYSSDNNVYELGTSKSDIMEVFIDKSEEIKRFIGEEKLKLKKENDLIKAFAFYNSL